MPSPSQSDITISPRAGCGYVLFLIVFAMAAYFIGKRDGRDEENARLHIASSISSSSAFDSSTAQPEPPR